MTDNTEASIIDELAEMLTPKQVKALSKYQPKLVILSTPYGDRSWFHEFFTTSRSNDR